MTDDLLDDFTLLSVVHVLARRSCASEGKNNINWQVFLRLFIWRRTMQVPGDGDKRLACVTRGSVVECWNTFCYSTVSFFTWVFVLASKQEKVNWENVGHWITHTQDKSLIRRQVSLYFVENFLFYLTLWFFFAIGKQKGKIQWRRKGQRRGMCVSISALKHQGGGAVVIQTARH